MYLMQLSLLGLLIFEIISKIDLSLVTRHVFDGILYEDFASDADNVRYSWSVRRFWSQLENVTLSYGIGDKAMFCTRGDLGLWFLYEQPEFKFGNNHKLLFIYGEYCVPVDAVNSIQPIIPLYTNLKMNKSVTTFNDSYFQTEKGNSSILTGPFKSLVFSGQGTWAIDVDGKKTCLVIQRPGDVCLLEDLKNTFEMKSDEVTITPDCTPGEGMEVYWLQNCYGPGYHELTYDLEFNLPTMKEICTTDYDENDPKKVKFVKVVNIWKNRITTPNLTLNQHDPRTRDRFDVLSAMPRIMARTCPRTNIRFLEAVQEIYSLHVKKGEIWNKDVLPDGTVIEKSYPKWANAKKWILSCEEKGEIIESVAGCRPVNVSEMKDEREAEIIDSFLNGEKYDYVIETMWLLINYVSIYCNSQLGFKNNDWVIYPHLFKRDFLYVVQGAWKNPGKYAYYYPLMFHGFDMDEEKKHMIGCVQSMMIETPYYDPLSRSPVFYSQPSLVETTTEAQPRRKRMNDLDYILSSDESVRKNIIGEEDLQSSEAGSRSKLTTKRPQESVTLRSKSGKHIANLKVTPGPAIEPRSAKTKSVASTSASVLKESSQVTPTSAPKTTKRKGKKGKKHGKQLIRKTGIFQQTDVKPVTGHGVSSTTTDNP